MPFMLTAEVVCTDGVGETRTPGITASLITKFMSVVPVTPTPSGCRNDPAHLPATIRMLE